MKLFICPKCGTALDEDALPAQCPNCGTSLSVKKQERMTTSNQGKSSFPAVFIFFIGFIGVLIYVVYNMNQKAEEQTRQEQYQKEQQAQRERQDAYLQNESKPKTMADYEDIMKQNKKIDRYREAFYREIDLINYKASMGEYQGVMRQKLFWDANDAFDNLYYAGVELERLMRKHGFEREAREHERKREDFRREYERVKRETLR